MTYYLAEYVCRYRYSLYATYFKTFYIKILYFLNLLCYEEYKAQPYECLTDSSPFSTFLYLFFVLYTEGKFILSLHFLCEILPTFLSFGSNILNLIIL